MSALLNGRSQANALPATCQVRWPRCFSSPSVTSGSSAAKRATSSKVCTNKRYCPDPVFEGSEASFLRGIARSPRCGHDCRDALLLVLEQRVGVVVQDRRLLVVGEAEF